MRLSPDSIVVGSRHRKDIDRNIRGLVQSIQKLGQLCPIGIDKDRNLIHGERRLRACKLLDRDVWAVEIEGLDDLVKLMLAERDENTEREPFTPSEAVAMGMAIEAIEKPKAEKRTGGRPPKTTGNLPEVSQPAQDDGRVRDKVAAAVGMSGRTYEKAKTVVEAAAQPEAPPEVIAAAEEMDRTGKVDPAFKKVAHVSHNSGNNEWYTPPQFIESARKAMGGIDLDPASSEVANRTVKATKYFTAETNGLAQKWSGRVWLNPPYSAPLIGQFAVAVANKMHDGEISQACVMVNNATETEWCQGMLARASAVCFPSSRVRFHDHTGTPAKTPLQGQAIIYFGSEVASFVREFKQHGACFRSCFK